MFDKNFYGFDPKAFTELFKSADMTQFFAQATKTGVDMEALMAAQQRNMEALVEANKAAAAGYQDLYKKQVAVFEETMTGALAQLSEMKMDQLTPEAASRQVELVQEGFDKAVANLTELAEAAKKANVDAMEILQSRVNEAIVEFKEMTGQNS